MKEWKEYKLGDFAQINPRESLKKGTQAKKIAMDVLEPFTRNIKCFGIEEYKGGVKFRNGDTLMARITPSLENGKTSYVDILENDEVGFGSTEFIVFREKKGISSKKFIYYLAVSPEVREIAILSMTGSSGRQRVQTDVLKEFIFEAPPLPEQEAIAGVLSSLDDKIDLLHRQNETLEAMTETLFRQWFVEEAKEDWEEAKMESLIKIGSGKGLKKGNFIKDGMYPILGANGEIGRTNKFLFDEKLIFTGRVGTLGNIFRVENEKVWLSDNTLVITPLDYFNFIYFTLKASRLQDYNIGSTQPLIRQSDIKDINIIIPPNKKLEKFEAVADDNFKKIKSNQTQIRTLTQLRDTLLPKLMSGEVRVEI